MAMDPPGVHYLVTEASIRSLGRWAAALLGTLGSEVLRELGRFARGAGPGSMITIRRTRDGFTAQVTGAIVGGRPAPISPDLIQLVTGEVDGDPTCMSS